MIRNILLAMSASRRLRAFATRSRLGWRAASRFVAGETIEDAVAVVAAQNDAGLGATLDHLGENVSSRPEAEIERDAYLSAIRHINAAGVRSGISLKLTALGLDLGEQVAEELLRQVVDEAAGHATPSGESGVQRRFVRIDMEASAYTQSTLDIFHRVFADRKNVGAVIQSYLFRSDADIEDLIRVGAGVRLVKGAYLEPPAIAYAEKADVDSAYIRQARRLLAKDARDAGVDAAFATHDEEIVDWIKAHAAAELVDKKAFEFQMLHGIRRDLQQQLVEEGYRMRVYVPYGREWYPYFMRRLAERPENLAFILRSVTQEVRR